MYITVCLAVLLTKLEKSRVLQSLYQATEGLKIELINGCSTCCHLHIDVIRNGWNSFNKTWEAIFWLYSRGQRSRSQQAVEFKFCEHYNCVM